MADVPDEDEDAMSDRAQQAHEDRLKDEQRPTRNFVDGNHAIRAGWALGCLMKAGVAANVEDDEHGNHTDVIRLSVDDQIIRLRVLPGEESTDA